VNLEAIEQRCLRYLREVSRPLVPIEQLLRHLHHDEACAGITEKELLGFLRAHELFRVVDPLGMATTVNGARELEDAGISSGPCVILSTRIPSADELRTLLVTQMERMVGALEAAFNEADSMGDTSRSSEVRDVLERARRLQSRVKNALEGS
jgi:hypothetical protein